MVKGAFDYLHRQEARRLWKADEQPYECTTLDFAARTCPWAKGLLPGGTCLIKVWNHKRSPQTISFSSSLDPGRVPENMHVQSQNTVALRELVERPVGVLNRESYPIQHFMYQ